MENIYGQTEQERNSIVELPEGFAEKAGNTLYMWLGSLWRSIHKGDKMIRGLQSARGIRLAQLYLDILEAARLQDRNGAPVFHRELWHPVVVRLSRRDTAQENMIEVGIDGEIGEQPAGSMYGEGTVFCLGKMANFQDYVTYPIDADIAGGAVSIVDNIVNPTVMMERGKDFEIRNRAIIFHRDNDPLGEASKFERYDIPGVLDDNGDEIPDMEAVLWASDVLIDKNYVADHISYALGANAPSSDVVKRIVNAAWSSVASGLTPELINTLIAAMLNIPVIQHEKETVRNIYIEKDDDGKDISRIVTTDLGMYRVSLKATLRRKIVSGATLVKGELLDESVRIYPFLNNVTAIEVLERPGKDTYSDWRFDPEELYGFKVDASSMSFSERSSSWQVDYVDPADPNSYDQYTSNESTNDALSVDLYGFIEGPYVTATRKKIHEDPVYSVDADAGTGFSVPLVMDVPSVTIPSSMIRARTEYGVYAMWNMAVVKKDHKGRLFFELGGKKEDVMSFWEDIWSMAEETGTDMESILGPEGTKVSPAAFFLQNLVGANTLFVVVDREQVDDTSMMRDPMFFDMLSAVVPSAIRLFLVEHRSVGDGDVADMGDASETSSVAASLPMANDVAEPSDEMVSMRFFRPPPAHVRGKREEE